MQIDWRYDQELKGGNAHGYTRMNQSLKAAGLAAGLTYDPAARISLALAWPRAWEPLADKTNVLFTMYESPSLHPLLRQKLPLADAIVVPSAWCREQLARCTDRPIHVVPLGVDPALFPGVRRPRAKFTPQRPFRWLWNGAHNLRKGWREVLDAWIAGGFVKDPRIQLYLKSTDLKNQDVRQEGNVVFDTRVVSEAGLLKLYAAADAFVFPTMGEGFGLTLLEAMATGLPCITNLYSGVTEFADATVCLGARWHPYVMEVAEEDEERRGETHYEVCIKTDVQSLVEKMAWVMNHWTQAKRLGLRAWKRAQGFTWARAGRRLVEVVVGIEKEEVEPCRFSRAVG